MAKTIMVVDDSLTMTKSLKSNLEMSGFAVLTAGDGVQAMSQLNSGAKPDLIITDINMPNMGGLELIRNVKALPGFRFTPILTLTTEGDGAMRDAGKKAGAAGWLVKPVRGTELVGVIKKILPGA